MFTDIKIREDSTEIDLEHKFKVYDLDSAKSFIDEYNKLVEQHKLKE